MSSPTKSSLWEKSWFPYLILTTLWLVIYQMTFNDKLNLGGDNAVYYILGDSINSGQGYSNIHSPAHNPNNHFPPGYPLILSFFMLFSKKVIFLKIVSGLFYLGTILLSFRIFELLVENKKLAFVIAGILLLNGNFIEYGSIMMSEIPFLFFSSLTILLFILSEKSANFLTDWKFWLMILLASFSFHIRTSGIALVGGLLLFLLANKEWKKFATFTVSFGLLGLPWFLRGKALGGSSYVKQLLQVNPYRPEDGMATLGDILSRVTYNIQRYFEVEIPRSFFTDKILNYQVYMNELTTGEKVPGYEIETFLGLGIALFVLIVLGVFNMKKYRTFVATYLLGSAAILLLWPHVWYGTRFILTLIPFMVFAFVLGIQAILQWIKVDQKISPLLYMVIALFFVKGVQAEADKTKGEFPPKYGDFLKIAEYVDQNLPEDVIVMNRKPGLFYINGHRLTTKFPTTFDYNEMRNYLIDNKVTHVVIDAMGFADVSRYLVPFVQANIECFKQVKHIQTGQLNTYLLEFNPNIGYEGEWSGKYEQGQLQTKEGKGIYRLPDGRIFEGLWKNNLKEGEGFIKMQDGSEIHGIWTNDQLTSTLYTRTEKGDTLYTQGVEGGI